MQWLQRQEGLSKRLDKPLFADVSSLQLRRGMALQPSFIAVDFLSASFLGACFSHWLMWLLMYANCMLTYKNSNI